MDYSREELQHMTMHDLISPDEKKIFLERTRVVDEEGSSLHERKLKRKDGCFVDTEVNVCRVKEVGYFAIIRDITERKKTETALRLSEEKFHSLINHAADAIFMVAGDGLIFDVNLGASELLLYTREELIGKSVLDLHLPEAREAIPGLWGRLKADKYLKDERILVRKDGTTVDVEVNRNMLPDGTGAIAIVRDISERKRIEADLIESKEQLALFVEHSPASLAMLDMEMRYIATSRRWLTDYNLGNKDITGKSHYEVFPEIDQEWKNIHQRCLRGAVEKREVDSFTRSDGTTDWLKWEIRPWHKASGETGGIIMFTEVITAQIESELKFKNLVEKSLVGVYIIQQGKFAYVNPKFAQELGYTQEEMLNLENSRDILFTGYSSPELEQWEKKADAGIYDDFHAELKCTRKDGTILWAEIYFGKTLYKGSNAIIGSFQDITERKNTETAIRDQAETFSAIIENANESICLISPELKVLQFNKTARDRLQQYWGKIISNGANFREFLYKGTENVFMEMFNDALTGKYTELESCQNNFEGKQFWLRTRMYPVSDVRKKLIGVAVLAENISNRKEVEKELEQNDERNRALVENISDGIILLGEDLSITYQSPSVERICGYSMEERRGHAPAELIHPEDLLEYSGLFERAAGSPGTYFQAQYRIRHKKDYFIWVDAFLINQLANKSIRSYIVIYRDITQKKKADAQLQKINHDLAERIKELECLHKLFELTSNKQYSLEEIISECVRLIPPAYQYPDITCARIVLGDDEYNTEGFKESEWMQQAFITLKGKRVGKVIVYYTEEKPAEREGPFLAEERYLITSIADILGNTAERKLSENEIIKLSRLYQFTSSINEMTLRSEDRDSIFSEACKIATQQGNFWMAWIGKPDKMEQKVFPFAWAGQEHGYLKNIEISVKDDMLANGPTGRALRDKTYYYCNDIANDPGMEPWKKEALKRGYRSSISLPIIVNEQLEAIYTLYMPEPFFFNNAEIKLLNEVTGNIAYALDKIRLRDLQKKSEDELRESEEKFRNLVEQTLVGVFILQDQHFIYVNPGFEKMIGYSKDCILNEISFDDIIHEDDLERVKANYVQRITGRKPSDQYTFKAIRIDGSVIFVEAIVARIIYNNRPAVIGTVVDITDRVEEEKRIGKAVNDAQEKERMQIGMELHDNVKQILAASLMNLDHVRSHLGDRKIALETLDNLKTYTKDAIDELRRLSHQLAPSINTEDTLIEKIKQLVETMNKENKLNVSIVVEEFEKPVSNEIQLAFYRILQEQFTNIQKYARAALVLISLKKQNGDLVFMISDDGTGFDPKIKKNGIGIENIKRRAQVLNGTVSIVSAPGKGCALSVRVPDKKE